MTVKWCLILIIFKIKKKRCDCLSSPPADFFVSYCSTRLAAPISGTTALVFTSFS